MKKKSSLLIVPFLALSLAGCNNDLQVPVESAGEALHDASADAIKLVTEFRDEVGSPESRSANLTVDICESTTYTVATGAKVAARSTGDVPDSTQVDVQYVKFHQGEKPGFAFVSSDPRINRVYVFIEKGEIADTAEVVPLKWYIDEIPGIVAEDIRLYYEEPKSRVEARTTVSIGPLLKTLWDQGAPYNRYLPACSNNASDKIYLGHCPTGCVPLAVAQVIAYCQRFQGTYYGNKDIDFDALTSVSSFGRTETSALATQAATFVHEVAMYCQVEFTCNVTHGDLKSGYQYLKDLGYTCSYVEGKGVDVNRLLTNLNKGIPHLSAGNTKTDGTGHAWVIDGLNMMSNGAYNYHCNWGTTGIHAGWVSDYRQPVENTIFNDNNRQVYITGY